MTRKEKNIGLSGTVLVRIGWFPMRVEQLLPAVVRRNFGARIFWLAMVSLLGAPALAVVLFSDVLVAVAFVSAVIALTGFLGYCEMYRALREINARIGEVDDGEFDVATMVHCETPTGALNDIAPVLERLHDRGVLTVVDAVSSLGGTPVPSERIDINLGASQKAFSSPPGLTTAAVSDRAWEVVEEREPDSLYTNLLPWRDTSEGFPYTHLGANVAALDESLSMLLEAGLDAVYERHEEAAAHCRERGADLGLDLYTDAERSAPTVTAFHLPGEAKRVQAELETDHDIVLATGLADLADDILRVGHMGYNADVEKVDRVMDALSSVV